MLKDFNLKEKISHATRHIVRMVNAVAFSVVVVGSLTALPSACAAQAPTQNITLYPLDANTRNIVSYSDPACTQKTGKVYGSDKCKILNVSGDTLTLEYPTSKGNRTAYVKKSSFTPGDFYSVETQTMSSKQTAYAYETGNSKIGTVYQNDTVYVLYRGSQRQQVIYPLDGGGYKCGWVGVNSSSSSNSNNSGNNNGQRTITNTLYGINSSNSRISCGFDGYTSTKGRHEGIDFSLGQGRAIYSLVNGTVTRVTAGGGSKLSTIAIYDSSHNITFVVLHSKPSVSVGQNISIGQQIGTEDKRGASSAHTHLEIRTGRRTAAAKSLNDYTLDNPNPAPYYQQLGYQVW